MLALSPGEDSGTKPGDPLLNTTESTITKKTTSQQSTPGDTAMEGAALLMAVKMAHETAKGTAPIGVKVFTIGTVGLTVVGSIYARSLRRNVQTAEEVSQTMQKSHVLTNNKTTHEGEAPGIGKISRT